MKKALFELIDLCMHANTAEDARKCLELFKPVQLQLDEYYATLDAPDHRLGKMLLNLRYYVKCWLDAAEYPRDWSRHLIDGIGRTLKKTAEYDFDIRYSDARRTERFQKQFDLYTQLRKQDKLPVEEGLDLPYDITIFLATYNQFELTKLCLESIFQNTDDVTREIFLIDNGSTDGTYEYFRNDSRVKLIRLVENVTLLPALQVFYESHLDSGRFWMYMNNDVVVTPRWASLMLDCIKSDPRIAMAVPITNRTDPTLSMKPPLGLYDIHKIQGFGEAFNHETNTWKECVVVWPYVSLLRPAFKRMLGYYEDYLHYQFYYSDADFVFAVRLSGYTSMQCANVYVHHFYGSASSAGRVHKMLDIGETQFYEKFGYFPSDVIYKLPYTDILDWTCPNAKILFVGSSRGNFVGDMRYYCKLCGLDKVRFYSADTMAKLKLDSIWDSSEFEQIDNIYALENAFPGETFDRIIFGESLSAVRHLERLLSILHTRLTMNGNLMFIQENNGSFPAFQHIFCVPRKSERDRVRLRKNTVLDATQMNALLRKAGFIIRSVKNIMLDEAPLALANLEKIKAYESFVHTDYGKAKLRMNLNRLHTIIVASKWDDANTNHPMEQILYHKEQVMKQEQCNEA